MAKLPVRFEANVGQMNDAVRFVARRGPSTLFLGDRGATLAVHKKQKRDPRHGAAAARAHAGPGERAVVNLTVAGGRSVAPRASDELVTKTNYFIGNDRSKWRTGIPSYAKVTYPSVLDGVDLVYHGENGALEYDFVVAPGTSVDTVAMNVDGAADMELNANGDLVIHTRAGDIVQPKPVVYQRDATGAKQTIASSYRIVDKKKVGFVVASYDRARELVIDPVLGFATHLGGGADDEVTGVAGDAFGNTYVTGYTTSSSPGFPVTPGAWDTTSNTFDCQQQLGVGPTEEVCGSSDAFVAKIDTSGSSILWATYLGGNGSDYASDIALTADNEPIVVGATGPFEGDAAGFPVTPNALNTTYHCCGEDGFVTRLNGNGGGLGYSTLLSGSGDDVAHGVAVDASGNAYVTGATTSPDFLEPVLIELPPDVEGKGPPSSGAFVVKLDKDGTTDLYKNVFGTSGSRGNSIAVDASGRAYVAGRTESSLSAVKPLQGVTGSDCSDIDNTDAFVGRLAANGMFDYLSCLGGSGYEEATGIAIDAADNAYVTGSTSSSNFPTTPGSHRPATVDTGPNGDAFVTKVNAAGTGLVYSTYLGHERYDAAFGIAVDASNTAWVTGATMSPLLPAPTPLPGTSFQAVEAPDAFVVRLNAAGSDVVFGTFYGGNRSDWGTAIAAVGTNVHVGGLTFSDDLPVFPAKPNALQNDNAGGLDGFVAKIGVPALLISPPSVILEVNGTQQFAATGGAGFGYVFSVPQNNSGAAINPSTGFYTAGANGGVADTVMVTDAFGATATAVVTVGAQSAELSLTPTNANVPPKGQRMFTAGGGTPPYQFGFASNASQGTIFPSGLYTAGPLGNVTDVIRVTDAAGGMRTATITVGAPITISPANPAAPPNGTIDFTATGGSGTGYNWSIANNGSGGATIGASTGSYKAGSGSNAVDTVQVTDSFGNKATVQVSVGGGLAISPSDPSTTPRGTVNFSAFGGSGSFAWSMVTSASGGTIDPATGVYTAGTVGNTIDTVQVVDSVGNRRATNVNVGPALTVQPAMSTVLTGVQIGFSGAGGSGAGYVWSIPNNQSGATIDANGLYTAGENPGTDSVLLTDSLGSTAEAIVVVEARPAPPGGPGGVDGVDGGTFDGLNIGGGGEDDCSCRAVGTSTSPSGARLIAGLALALGLVLRRRRR